MHTFVHRYNTEILRVPAVGRSHYSPHCFSSLLHPGEARENQMQTPTTAKVLVGESAQTGFGVFDDGWLVIIN